VVKGILEGASNAVTKVLDMFVPIVVLGDPEIIRRRLLKWAR
jgi:hypothetical protein